MRSLKSIQKEEINEIVKNIENKKYTIGDKRLKENLEKEPKNKSGKTENKTGRGNVR